MRSKRTLVMIITSVFMRQCKLLQIFYITSLTNLKFESITIYLLHNRKTTSEDSRLIAQTNFYLKRRLKEQARKKQAKIKKNVLPGIFGSEMQVLSIDHDEEVSPPSDI